LLTKKPTILFIQGGGEGAYEADKKLSSFLKDALKDLYIVHHPIMPDENDPDYEKCKTKIHEELNKIDDKVILVGHSLGSCFLLKYLSEEKIDKDIAGILLISTPFWGGGGWQYEGFRLKNDFVSQLPTTPIFFYHSIDDEVVPFSHLALYAKEIPRAKLREIVGGGHQLNNDLSEVVQDIKNLSA
jgi:predicted alpha/beta hydrolase family esterase